MQPSAEVVRSDLMAIEGKTNHTMLALQAALVKSLVLCSIHDDMC